MLPTVQVSRLPSASSFYAAITQPLDIRYLTQPPPLPTPALSSSSSSSSSSGSSLSLLLACPANRQVLTFGTADTRKPLFQLCPATPSLDKPFRASYLVLSAYSLDEVHAFHAAALRANPLCAAVIGTRASLDSDSATVVAGAAAAAPLESSEICARITDSDGNTMEVAYRPSLYAYSSYYDGASSSRHHPTAGADYGDRRVLHWSQSSPDTDLAYGSSRYGVSMPADYSYYAHDALSPSGAASRYQGGGGRSALRRSATDTSAAYGLSTQDAPKGGSRNSVGMVGMLGMAAMGAAAGAALTYSVMSSRSRSQTRSSRDRAYEEATVVPPFRRQATFPDAYPAYAPTRCSGYEGMRGASTTSRREMRALPDAYDYDDGRSRHSASRSYAGGEGSRVRGHSETPRNRTPLLTLGDDSYRSTTSRRGSAAGPPPPPPSIKRSSTYDHGSVADRGSRMERSDRSERGERSERSERSERGESRSHVSSRSHRTVRASERGSSRGIPAATPPNASRSASVRQGRPGSYFSARHVPLPQSGAGSSHARWDVPDYGDDRDDGDDEPIMFDDCDSIAPSDSISCVGSRRRRHH